MTYGLRACAGAGVSLRSTRRLGQARHAPGAMPAQRCCLLVAHDERTCAQVWQYAYCCRSHQRRARRRKRKHMQQSTPTTAPRRTRHASRYTSLDTRCCCYFRRTEQVHRGSQLTILPVRHTRQLPVQRACRQRRPQQPQGMHAALIRQTAASSDGPGTLRSNVLSPDAPQRGAEAS